MIRCYIIPFAGAFAASLLQAAPLVLDVVPHFDGERLRPDSLRYATSETQTISVERLSFLLSGFALQQAESARWEEAPGDPIAYIDLAGGRLRITLPEVPEGRYQAIRFDIGLPPEVNHADPASFPAGHPLNPNLNGLHWTWAEGYIFCALEGRFRNPAAAEQPGGYALHLGNDWARSTISLATRIEIGDGPVSALVLPLDVARIFRFPKAIDLATTGNSTHSRTEEDTLAAALRGNLLAAWGEPRNQQADPAETGEPRPAPLYLPAEPVGYRFPLRKHMPRPSLPLDNPLLVSRVDLGRTLFFDPLLSADGTVSCASCHQPESAFSDPRIRSLGVGNAPGVRHSMPLFNLAWKSEFFWDGRASSLREQVVHPLIDPLEMGNSSLEEVTERITETGSYPALFRSAFGAEGVTGETVALALENFLLTLTSQDSLFDRALRGEGELGEDAQRGFELFFTEHEPRTGRRGADCFHCHGGPLFTDHRFRNNGLPPLPGAPEDLGRAAHTGREADRNRFAVPALRNVALTAPYMHDGRFSTLAAVLDHYSSGIHRSATIDPNLAKHPAPGIPLTARDKADLLAFLRSLSDPQFARD